MQSSRDGFSDLEIVQVDLQDWISPSKSLLVIDERNTVFDMVHV